MNTPETVEAPAEAEAPRQKCPAPADFRQAVADYDRTARVSQWQGPRTSPFSTRGCLQMIERVNWHAPWFQHVCAAGESVSDLKAGKTTDSDELTEEVVAKQEEDFPEHGKHLRAAFNRVKELESKVPKHAPAADAPDSSAAERRQFNGTSAAPTRAHP